MGKDMGQITIRIILGSFIEIEIRSFHYIWIANINGALFNLNVIIPYSICACKFTAYLRNKETPGH